MNQQTNEQMDEQSSKPVKSDQVLTKTQYRNNKPIKQLIEQLRNNIRWNLSSRKYSPEHLEAVFEQLTNPLNLANLWLYWNSIENVCNLVIKPKYNQLKIMNIGGNNIVSVEPLSHADMPTLQELWLWNNRLTRVDCLRKMYVPNLKYIDLSSNFITEWSRISQMNSAILELISINNNSGLAYIDYVAKLLARPGKKIISFLDSNLVSMMGKSCRNGKKNAKNYKFPSQKVEYI